MIEIDSAHIDETLHYPSPERLQELTQACNLLPSNALIDTIERFAQCLKEMRQATHIAMQIFWSRNEKSALQSIGYGFHYKDANDEALTRSVYIPLRHKAGQPNIPVRFFTKGMLSIFEDHTKQWFVWSGVEGNKLSACLQSDGLPMPRQYTDGYLCLRVLNSFPEKINPPNLPSLAYIQTHGPHPATSVEGIYAYLKQYQEEMARLNHWRGLSKKSAFAYFQYLPTALVAAYAALFCLETMDITQGYKALCRSVPSKQLMEDFHTFGELLSLMEQNGLYVDPERLDEVEKYFLTRQQDVLKEYGTVETRADIQRLMQDHIPVEYKTTDEYPTDKISLKRMSTDGYKMASSIYQWLLCADVMANYIRPWKEYRINNKLHTTFLNVAAKSVRTISCEPNVFGIPQRQSWAKPLRRCFTIEPKYKKTHVWMFADFSQMDLRILAHCSQDPKLVEAFKQNVDIHTQTAQWVIPRFEQLARNPETHKVLRAIGKELNLAVIYGLGVRSMHDRLFELGIEKTLEECEQLKHSFKSFYYRASRWEKEIRESTKQTGLVTNVFGLTQRLPLNISDQASFLFTVPNWVLQSSAAILFMRFLNQVQKLAMQAGIVLLWKNAIHDEGQFLVERAKVLQMFDVLHQACQDVTDVWSKVPFVVGVEYTETHQGEKRILTRDIAYALSLS